MRYDESIIIYIHSTWHLYCGRILYSNIVSCDECSVAFVIDK